jgi:hypothetical protein
MPIDAELVAIIMLSMFFLLASALTWMTTPEWSDAPSDRYTRGETAKLEVSAGSRIHGSY